MRGLVKAARGISCERLVKMRDLSALELEGLLRRGQELCEGQRPQQFEGALATIFYENSTRTQNSFRQAGRRLGLETLHVGREGSSIQKGETLEDTLHTLRSLGAVIGAVRTTEPGALDELAPVGIPLVNAGDGWRQHPTQALADLLAVRLAGRDIAGATLLVIGDILHSRVARSAADGFAMLGARVLFSGPPTLVPPGLAASLGAEEVSLADGLAEADIVMVLRLQTERMERGYLPSAGEYRERWGLTAERLRRLRPDVLVLHPGPQNRGVELDAEVIYDERSLIHRQIECGVAMRTALMEAMLDAR
jgi:aspartate carbamoyltransferase catalytic subunit